MVFGKCDYLILGAFTIPSAAEVINMAKTFSPREPLDSPLNFLGLGNRHEPRDLCCCKNPHSIDSEWFIGFTSKERDEIDMCVLPTIIHLTRGHLCPRIYNNNIV